RLGAFVVLHLQNHLVLIGRFLDEVGVVLRVGIVEQDENPRVGGAVKRCLIAQDVYLQARCVVVQVRGDEQEAWKFMHFRHQRVGGVVHLGGVDSGDGIGKLTVRVGGCAGADLQHGVGLKKGDDPRNGGADLPHQLPGDGGNGRALVGILQERS